MTLSRSQRLTAHLAQGAALPFVWGERDCCLWVSDWIRAERGLDPAGALRGAYASQRDCVRLLIVSGGLVRLVSAAMARAGLAETVAPEAGDVGIVMAAGIGAMMAIRAGEIWALKTSDGIALIPAKPLMAWSL